MQYDPRKEPTKGFIVTGENGILTIPGSAPLMPDNYTIEVVDITSIRDCRGNGSFSIKRGMYQFVAFQNASVSGVESVSLLLL